MRIKALLLLVFGSAAAAMAQQNMTLYNMGAVPQRLQVNPAMTPDSKVFVGLPVLSSSSFNAQISAFNLGRLDEAIYDIPNSDSTGFDLTKLSDVFNKDNVISLQQDQDILTFGFKIKKNYFHVSSAIHTDFRMSYPGDMFDLIFEGNGTQSSGETNLGRTFEFPFAVDALMTADIGLGYTREVTDKLFLGAKVKRIFGILTINTERNDVTFQTRPDDYGYIMTSDIAINSASAFGNFLDSSGTENADPSDVFGEGRNGGWGFDIGGRYKINKRFDVHASIIDLGFINWEKNTTRYQSRNPGAQFVYDGIEIDNIFSDTLDIGESFSRLGDSIIEEFDLDSSGGSFRQSLFTEFYLGGNFHLNKNHNAGLLFYGSFYNKKLLPGVTLSWNSRLTRVFSISASASYMAGTIRNVGLGTALNLGPVQTYVVSDNILGPFNPLGVKNISIRFGMNLVFGRKQKSLDEQQNEDAEPTPETGLIMPGLDTRI